MDDNGGVNEIRGEDPTLIIHFYSFIGGFCRDLVCPVPHELSLDSERCTVSYTATN